jgi:hypothetical protein
MPGASGNMPNVRLRRLASIQIKAGGNLAALPKTLILGKAKSPARAAFTTVATYEARLGKQHD